MKSSSKSSKTSFLTYSDMKNRPILAKIKLTKNAKIILAVVLVVMVGFGGNALINWLNNKQMRDLSKTVMTQLISNGNYASIKQYAGPNFLGNISEADYDASAKSLTSLKGSVVAPLNAGDNTVFGTITPKDPSKDGTYLFGYTVTFKKTGLMNYKVTNIVTDYGRDSFFQPN